MPSKRRPVGVGQRPVIDYSTLVSQKRVFSIPISPPAGSDLMPLT